MRLTNDVVYTCNSVNSTNNCMSWGTWLACGMSKSVVLINQTKNNCKIIQQFEGHQDIVTCLSWINDCVLVSADNSSNVIVWIIHPETGKLMSWQCHNVSSFSSSPITSIHGLEVNGTVMIVCASESKIQLLTFSKNDDKDGHNLKELCGKQFPPNFVLAVNMMLVSEKSNVEQEPEQGSVLLVISGLDDGRIICNGFDIVAETFYETTISLVGHEDWISCLDSITLDNGISYLCSSSQDSFSRVWKIKVVNENGTQTETNPLEVHKLSFANNVCDVSICLDGVLAGHENWVTRSRFRYDGEIVLMTTSMDKSTIIWKRCPMMTNVDGDQENKDNLVQWCEVRRLGQVGGNTLGLIGGDMSPDASMIVGFGYQGDMVAWGRHCRDSSQTRESIRNDGEDEDLKLEEEGDEVWETIVNLGGHFDAVEDLAWERDRGLYLLTVSKDQTTRIHAPWRQSKGLQSDIDNVEQWHEVARPQIHGFDMTTVASINSTTFVTGAEEKISRVFGMNKDFAKYFQNIYQQDDLFPESSLRSETVSSDALGLSNKLSSSSEINGGGNFSEIFSPKEENRAGRTLWPEVTKLYGHVYEVFRVSSHPTGSLVATTCKALLPEYADIILWDTATWTIVQRLPFHRSTVLRVKFNNNGDKMVSVSKDRQWALWHSDSETEPNFRLQGSSKKANQHSKIIWDTDWTQDDRCFVTVSRDKKMALWDAQSCEMIGKPLVFDESANAVATMSLRSDTVYVFAVGLQSGVIQVVQFTKQSKEWTVLLTFTAHHDWITRLQFSPVQKDKSKFLLASCAKDRFVKIFQLSLAE